MDNFIFGLSAVLQGTIKTLSQVMEYELFWGFILGFFTSTIVHTLLIVEKPTDIPFILFRDQAIAFEHTHNMQGDKYNSSFHVFCDAVNKIKLTFGIVTAFMLVGLLFAVLSI